MVTVVYLFDSIQIFHVLADFVGQDRRIEAISLFTGIGGLELGLRRLGKPLNSHVVSAV